MTPKKSLGAEADGVVTAIIVVCSLIGIVIVLLIAVYAVRECQRKKKDR
jgi:hypothetical protein